MRNLRMHGGLYHVFGFGNQSIVRELVRQQLKRDALLSNDNGKSTTLHHSTLTKLI
jgi:hypothetical protein